MKKVFSKLIVFSMLIVLIYTFIYIYVLRINNHNTVLTTNRQVLFFGHSHTSSAYNDSIIINSKNIAEGGESFFFTYYKLKSIIDQNPNKIVFIEFSNNQLDTLMDRWTYKDPFLSNKYPRYAPFISSSGHLSLITHSPISFINSVFLSYKLNFNHLEESKYNLLVTYGGFHTLDTSLISNVSPPFIESNFTYNPLSKVSITYLKKIIIFLKKSKVKFYLIRTPFHQSSDYWNYENKFQEILKNEFRDIPFLDFGKLNLPNKYYLDNEHLNLRGASEYSKRINNFFQSYNFLNLENHIEDFDFNFE